MPYQPAKMPAGKGVKRINQQADCPICHGSTTTVVKKAIWNASDVVRCLRCSMVWTHPAPQPEDLAGLYADEPMTPEWEQEVLRWMWPSTFYKYRLDAMRRYRPTGRLLDIGVGFGHFFVAAQGGPWEVHGIDIAEPVARYVKNHHGLEITLGPLEGRYPNAYFDCLHMKDVIEHVCDPLPFLRECARIVRPGGLLVVDTLNIDSLVARIAGARYTGAFIPGHVSYFSPATLRRALSLTGFAIRQVWAGDEVPWLQYLRLRPLTKIPKRILKKLRLGNRTMGSIVVYATRS